MICVVFTGKPKLLSQLSSFKLILRSRGNGDLPYWLQAATPRLRSSLEIVFVLMCDKYILSLILSTTFLFGRLNQRAQLWDKGLATEPQRHGDNEEGGTKRKVEKLLVSVSLWLCG
jgi:hypothetical protein